MDSERFLSWNWFYITRLENSRNQKSPTNCGEEPEIFVTPIEPGLGRRFRLEEPVQRYGERLADEIEERIPVIPIFQRGAGLQDRVRAEIGFKGAEKRQDCVVEIAEVGTEKRLEGTCREVQTNKGCRIN